MGVGVEVPVSATCFELGRGTFRVSLGVFFLYILQIVVWDFS